MKLQLSRFLNNVTGLQVFQLLRFSALLFISVLFAKSHLSQEDIGIYETLLLLSGALSFFWVSGSLNALLPIYEDSSPGNRRILLFQSFITTLAINVLLVLILLLYSEAIINVLTDSGELPYYRLFCLFILFNNPGFLVEYIYLLKNEARKILLYGLSIFPLQLLLVCVPVYLGYGIEYSIYGLIAFAVLKFIWLIRLLSIHSSPGWDAKLFQQYAKLAAPLILSLFLGGMAQYIDGLIISNYFDRATFAVFQYGARELPLTLLLANAFSAATIPLVASRFSEALISIRKRSARLMHILFPLSMLLLLTSKWLYPLVFNPDFQDSYLIFNIYLLLIISRLLFPQTLLIGLKKTRIILFAAFIEIIVNVSLSLILLPHWGMQGVAFATVIAHLTDKFILGIYCRFFTKIAFSSYTPWKPYLVYSIILVACFLITIIQF